VNYNKTICHKKSVQVPAAGSTLTACLWVGDVDNCGIEKWLGRWRMGCQTHSCQRTVRQTYCMAQTVGEIASGLVVNLLYNGLRP